MRHSRFSPSFLRSLRPLPALFVCLAMLAGCRFGDAIGFFDEDNAIAQAIGTFKERMSAPVRVLNLTIAPDRVTFRLQDPNNRHRVDEWRFERMHVAGLNWERVSGPSPYELTLINPDLEANLFELDEVDFASAIKLARAAVERAGLADKARVARMDIARQVFVLPAPSSGEIRWTVDVSSGREAAQVFADARGTIVGMNVDGTLRAKNLDILRELGLTTNAARAFRFVLGSDAILTMVSISPHSIGFETNVADSSPPVPISGTLSARRVYTWNLNGLQRALSAVNADAALGKTRYAFSIDDIDWTILPKIAVAAPAQLAMPQGRVTGIELSKPANAVGPPIVLWKVEVTDQNKEKGFILADTAGVVKQVLPPQSQRKPVDWYDPRTMLDTLARIGVQFGRDRKFAEIAFLNDKVVITAENHMEPNVYGQILLNDGGFERFGTPSTAATRNVPFRIDDLKGLTLERMRDLEAQTLARLKMPPKTISSITIGRGSMDPSPSGNVTIEIRAEEKQSGRAGRVNYELDGTVIRAYLP